MALSKDLEEELTCPIDLEYFEEPMQLKCLHLLCKKDVDQMLDEDDLLQCPVCKRISEKRDIKKDFRIKRLIELVKGDANKLKEQQTCEFCDEELAASWCQDCKMYLGKQCEKVHKRTPVIKEHNICYIEDIISDGKERIQKYLLEIKTQVYEHEQNKEKWVKAKEDAMNPQIFDKIQESEDAIITETKRVHDELRKQMQIKLSKGTDHFDTKIANLNSKIEFLSRKVQILRDIIESDDKKTLLNKKFINELVDTSLTTHEKCESDDILPTSTQNVNISLSSREQVITELRRLQIITNDKGEKESLPISNTSVRETGAIPKKHTDPSLSQVSNALFANESSPIALQNSLTKQSKLLDTGKTNINFTTLSNRTLRSQVVCKLEVLPLAISVIRNDVWIVFDSGEICIYQELPTHKVNKIKSIVINKQVNTCSNNPKSLRYEAMNVIDCNDGSIIAACYGILGKTGGDNAEDGEDTKHVAKDLGLVIIDINGLIQDIIAEGKFWDVSHDSGHHIYGLLRKKVDVYMKNEQGWCKVKSFYLELPAHHLCLANTRIIMSNSVDSTVASYNLESNRQQQLANKGQDVGEVNNPYVRCSDGHGNVLICDYNNHRIQVLLTENTWKVLKVNREFRYPRGVAVGNNGRLYIVSNYKLYVLE